jgi:hypothetical protein
VRQYLYFCTSQACKVVAKVAGVILAAASGALSMLTYADVCYADIC